MVERLVRVGILGIGPSVKETLLMGNGRKVELEKLDCELIFATS